MADVDPVIADYTDQSGGSDVQAPSSPLRETISIAGKAVVGVIALRAARSSRLGRELLGALSHDLRANRLAQTIRHAALPFFESYNAAGMPIKEMALKVGQGELAAHDIRLSGLTGLAKTVRNRAEQEMGAAGIMPRDLTFGQRIEHEKAVLKDTWSTFKKQTKAIWDFYGEPAVHRRRALGGEAYPTARMNRADRYFWEAALAARQTPVRDSQVMSTGEVERLLAKKTLPKDVRADLERIQALRAATPKPVMEAALAASARFGHTHAGAINSVYNALIEDMAHNPQFRRAPHLGAPELVGLGTDRMVPETFEHVATRLREHGRRARRFQVTEQGQSKFVSVPLEAYEKAIEAAGGTTLYTGRFIDKARGGRSWDPYESSLRNVAFSGLKALSHFRVPLLGFSPAQFFKPRELEQWYGQGRMVQQIQGGSRIWVGTGERYQGLGRYQSGKLLRSEFGFLPHGPIDEVAKAQLAHDEALLGSKITAVRQAVITSSMDPAKAARVQEILEEQGLGLTKLLTKSWMETAQDTSRLKPTHLRQSLWENKAAEAFTAARFRGFSEEHSGVVLTPGGSDIAHFISSTRGHHATTPLPGEIMPFAQDQTEPLYNYLGELDPSHASRWARGVSGVIEGLAKIGIDWRHQPEKPIPLKIFDMVSGLFGKGPSVLHVQDYGVSWTHAQGRSGGAWSSNYDRRISDWAENFLLRRAEGASGEFVSGGVSPWQGLRMEAVAFGETKVGAADLAGAIETEATRAVREGDWAAYQRLYRHTVPGKDGFSTAHFGQVKVGEDTVNFRWKARSRQVPTQNSQWLAASGEDVSQGLKTWAAFRPLEVLNMTGLGGFDPATMRGPWDVFKAGAKRVAQAYYAYQAIQYADYQVENFTGVSPIKSLVNLGAGIDVTRKAIMTPVVYGAKALEAIEPGSIDSPLSYLARSLGPLAIGAAMSYYTHSPKPLMIGAAASFFLSGSLTETAGEAADIYSGEQNVPVRRGRWWGMSDGSFFGDDVTEWRPHWVAQMRMDAKYKGYPYQDKHQYWQTQMGMPVPENWFGLRGLLKPYEHDEYLQSVGAPTIYSSPHPFTQIPVIGPLLTPLGALLKPPKMMHPELGLPTEPAEEASARAAIQSIATRNNLALADEGMAAQPASVEGPYSLRAATRKFFRYTEELFGIYSWLAGTVVKSATGIKDQGSYHYETAADDVSASADYWEMDLGGGLGYTEFIRRLFPRPRSGDQAISNVPNMMPSWLPSGEDMRGKDYHTGNPYCVTPDTYVETSNGLKAAIDFSCRFRLIRTRNPGRSDRPFRKHSTIQSGPIRTRRPSVRSPSERSDAGFVFNLIARRARSSFFSLSHENRP